MRIEEAAECCHEYLQISGFTEWDEGFIDELMRMRVMNPRSNIYAYIDRNHEELLEFIALISGLPQFEQG